MVSGAYHSLEALPHLRAVLTRFAPHGRGNCMQQSVAMVMDLPTAKLVIGTTFDDPDGEGYMHAWVKDRGRFYDPSLYVEEGVLRAHHTVTFLAERKACEVHVIARRVVMDFAKVGRLSRWMRSDRHPDHALPGVMGEVLLDRLAIPYSLGPNRELWPAAGLRFTDQLAQRAQAFWQGRNGPEPITAVPRASDPPARWRDNRHRRANG